MYIETSTYNKLKSTEEFWLLQLNAYLEVWIQTTSFGYRIHGLCHTMFSGYFEYET
ncbi:hypothetical protein DPMN_056415 [Dreissena polymorpha]|uniref:Uncharacterized protein n=1 Tax=Dreissena polymorpha TaxID=45954 RepID=A0A9D4CRN0_DREPO|nr:hypothetical protein DPMN_056415 [Dreissena polymorpha]